MHPEIEKLIVLALNDGKISEKELDIIMRKADTLEIDRFEVEMYLAGIPEWNDFSSSNFNNENFALIDFEYSPYYEERGGFSKKDILLDLEIFKNFLVNTLQVKIEKSEIILDTSASSDSWDNWDEIADEDDTCIIRFYVIFNIPIKESVENNRTKIELFSRCPWVDNRKDCFYPYVSIFIVNYEPEFLFELKKTDPIWTWERVRDGLVRIEEGTWF